MLTATTGRRRSSPCRSSCAWPDVYGAAALMDISQAHIDSTIYLGDATLEFAERLASLGARVAVPTSLNVSGVDECGWKDWAVSPEWAAKAARQMLAYERMGAVADVDLRAVPDAHAPGVRPADRLGRVERDRVRELGDRRAHRALSRSARHLLRDHRPRAGGRPAPDREPRRPDAAAPRRRAGRRCRRTISSSPSSAIWSASSPATASRSSTASTSQPAEDQLKAFSAAAASSGRVALFHMVGVTPEAPTLDAAFQGRPPEPTDRHHHRGPARRARRADDRRRPRAGHGDPRQPAFLAGRVHAARAAGRRPPRASAGQVPRHLEPADEGACRRAPACSRRSSPSARRSRSTPASSRRRCCRPRSRR